jgi:MoxR-like ATPase
MEPHDETILETSNKEIQQLTEQSKIYAKLLNEAIIESQKNIVGKKDVLEKIMISIISEGHILLESVPGLAKTLMVKTMAQIFSGNHVRIQFTPDLLPADITGTKIFKSKTDTFQIEKGPIFHNFVLADEINRAPPKVQSALLEAMQEKQVSIHGDTIKIEKPFIVFATQNPIETEGTYKLPEAQIDRFSQKIIVPYPTKDEEIEIIERYTKDDERKITPTISINKILEIQKFNKKIYADKTIAKYVTNIVDATRNPHHYNLDLENTIEFGASPRASIWLIKTAKANAMLHGRGFVIPEDVKQVAHEVLRHRIILSFEAEVKGINSDSIITTILEKISPP